MVAETGELSVEQLTETRKAAKTLWESGVLQPHEKTHLWEIMMRIDGAVKERRQQEPTG